MTRRDDTLQRLRPFAITPLDLGVARFAADLVELATLQPDRKESPLPDAPVYAIEHYQLEKLRRIMTRLYQDDKPFVTDERRDLANEMYAVLNSVANVPLNTD